jgi:hypothetical protein
MANKQIDELSELTTVEETDLLVVYDVDEAGSEKTKKILKSNFLAYAEGTFTPEVADLGAGGNVASVGSATGKYVKIGNMVSATMDITDVDTTGLTGANILRLRNLPYQSASTAYCAVRTANVTFVGYLTGQLPASSSGLQIMVNTNGSVNTYIQVNEITSGSADFFLTITYITS